jgi:hypothetical protein
VLASSDTLYRFGGHVKKEFVVLRNVVGTGSLVLCTAGFILAGFVFLNMIPDIKRYVKMSRM